MYRLRTRPHLFLSVGLLALYACADTVASRHVVVLDPGHPSETSEGTRGPSGLTENHVNWVIGQKLRALLEERGYAVIMTKLVEDELVTNRHRADIANYNAADLMVRLHCDAGDHHGTATFYPDRQGTRFGVTGPNGDVIAGSAR